MSHHRPILHDNSCTQTAHEWSFPRKIVEEILHNFSHIRQLHLAITVACSTNLTEALALVRSILALNPAVLKDPAPAVGITH